VVRASYCALGADRIVPLTIVDRGPTRLVAEGRLAKTAADTLKDEARRRVQGGQFCGHIAYASLIPHP
jgi:hypothetical protein